MCRLRGFVLALSGALLALGCTSSGQQSRTYKLPGQRVAHPACEAHWIDVPAGVELGRVLNQPRPATPAGGPAIGYVCVIATMSREGRLVDPEVVATNNKRYADAFLRVLQEWQYDPSTQGGEPIEFRTLVSVSYQRLHTDASAR